MVIAMLRAGSMSDMDLEQLMMAPPEGLAPSAMPSKAAMDRARSFTFQHEVHWPIPSQHKEFDHTP